MQLAAEQRTVAIIQARQGSSRLPGKVLHAIGPRSMLAWVVERLRRATHLDAIVVATTTHSRDDAIVDACEKLACACCRGPQDDVLTRYFQAAQQFPAAFYVRITADCPLIDPTLVDAVIDRLRGTNAAYASNGLVDSYPRGLDVEAFTAAALARACQEASLPHQRVHVTPYFYEHPELFELLSVRHPVDCSAHRWTVDTPEDLAFVRGLCACFAYSTDFSWSAALAMLATQPHLLELNRGVAQKACWEL